MKMYTGNVVRVNSFAFTFKIFFLILGCFFSLGSFARKDSLTVVENPVVLAGRTTGQFPFMKFGPGTDRLGGAKMGYLDTAIVLQVIDSLKDDYIIRLAQNQHAFIPKENVRLTGDFIRAQYYLTSSWKVSGDEKYDYVTIGLDERLPYKTIQQTDPSRIVIDIYGATGNTNWITQLKSAKEVSAVYHEQTGDDVFRVTIELRHLQQWGYWVRYKNKTLAITIKRPPKRLTLNHLKIAVDAGHGGKNTGATGINTGTEEKVCNLQIAKELEKCLKRRNGEVFMTRNGDDDLTMSDRLVKLRDFNPDLMISIHHNSSSNTAVKGVSTYYRYPGSKSLTVFVLNRLLELGLDEFGNIGSFNFSLNGPTEFPNCLVEVAFMSNGEDEKRLLDPQFQTKVAKKIRKGIIDWLRRTK